MSVHYCTAWRWFKAGKIKGYQMDTGTIIITEELDGAVLELVVRPDHVHLFAEFPPTIAPYQIMHRIKGATSHHLRQEVPQLKSRLPSLWTRSYYVGTAGAASAETIHKYIEAQEGR